MIRRPPRSTRTDTLFPYTTLFRSLAIAVTGEPVDSVALHVFNNPHFSSLASPTRLGELLPNLRIVEEIQVPARALDEIIAELSVDDAARNLLVIDAPGQAGALLGNVSIAALHFFSDVIVRSAVEPLYAGRSEEHTSELQSLMRSSYAVFCLKKKTT